MRLTASIPLPPGSFVPGHRFDPAQLPDVRDPSRFAPVGRVVSVHVGADTLELVIDVTDERLTAALAENATRGVSF